MDDTLSYHILQVAKAHRQQAQQALSAAGIYVGQEIILMQLWEQDGLALSQLVEQACVQPATVTKMLNRMERMNLVERRPDPSDRRAKRIYLTQAGRDLQGQTAAAWEALETVTVRNLTAGEQEQLKHLLAKVLDGLQTEGEFPPCDS